MFAIRDLKAEELVCPYSGYVYRNKEELGLYNVRYLDNATLSDEDRRWSTKYSITVNELNIQVEIPPEADLPGMWHPTLGPKVRWSQALRRLCECYCYLQVFFFQFQVNSEFPQRGMNAIYQTLEHPR